MAATGDRNSDLLVWMDLEMTGLVAERDTIVEIGCMVTDAGLTPLDDGIAVVIHHDDDGLAVMDDFVRNMHRRSGLLTEISESTVQLADAEARVMEYLTAHVPKQGQSPLCGNSIGMDRRFLARYMPTIDNYLHYRSIDVSSIKELCRRWYPEIYRKRPGKAEQHRAIGDILESIAELRYYRETLFAVPATSD